jgi:DNA-binding SARP family transcriptional activator
VSVEFRILGPLEARSGGRRLELGGPRQRSVLAVLLLHAGDVVPASVLIDEVWGDAPPETAVNLVQGYVSELRKVLGSDVIATRGRGYAIDIAPSTLDLHRFEELMSKADGSPAAVAADRLRRALALWRGPAFADLVDEPFAHAVSARLDELRLMALERRIDADLAIGRHSELAGELEQLTREHPLRERLRALLMLALYRCGRQAEALDAYQAARSVLVDQLGIEPAPALRELHAAILRQDRELEVPEPEAHAEAPGPEAAARSILVVPTSDPAMLRLVAIAEPLARRPPRELIVLRLLDVGEEPAPVTARLSGLRDELVGRGLPMRVAAYTSGAPGEDAVLATEQDADLLLVDAAPNLLDSGRPDRDLDAILRLAPCDVALLVSDGSAPDEPSQPVVVPFGGVEHDWSAVELAAWVARSRGTTLRLVGTSADRLRGRRDASRLLGRASLVIQAVAGIVVEPALVRGGADGVLEAASDASLLVVGMSSRWQHEGLGHTRLALANRAGAPVLLVRRGLRPGGLAPKESMTRFTWSLSS